MKHPSSPRAGFTLVEFSIAIAIIGLLIGGVLAGQSLMETAKRKQMVTTWSEMNTAVHNFKTKYLYLPGDLPDASAYFTGLNNGDGNGIIWGCCGSFGHGGFGREYLLFWQHLATSGLIEQTFPNCDATVFRCSPQIPFGPQSSYIVVTECVATDCNNTAGPKRGTHYIWTQNVYNNTPSWGLHAGISSHMSTSPFTPEEVLWFDTKLDDGYARSGDLTLMYNTGQPVPDGNACIDLTNPTEYKTSETRPYCHIRFKTTF